MEDGVVALERLVLLLANGSLVVEGDGGVEVPLVAVEALVFAEALGDVPDPVPEAGLLSGRIS